MWGDAGPAGDEVGLQIAEAEAGGGPVPATVPDQATHPAGRA